MVGADLRTRYAAFGDHQVAVVSDVPEVLAAFELTFRYLLVDEPSQLVHTLRVSRQGAGYAIEGARLFFPEDDSLRSALQCLKFEIVHQFVERHPEMLWLHAGSAAAGNRAVILCGAWGRGKSTMVAHLCLKGWRYLSDDIVPIDMQTGKLVPFPLTPMMRIHDAGEDRQVLSAGQIAALQKQLIDLDPESFAREPVAPFAIVFPQYDPAADIALTPFSPAGATMELLQNCLNLRYHRDEAVRFLGRLVEQLPVYGLRYNDGDRASDEIVRISA